MALRALAEQTISLPSHFEFHFVERDPAVEASLRCALTWLEEQRSLPANVEIHVHGGATFEEAYDRDLRPRLVSSSNAPAFALVDPFGWTGLPMRILRDLLGRPHTEVLVNFMFEEINRFLAHEAQPANFDALFGDPDWRQCCALSGHVRTRAIHDFYRDQLHAIAKAKHVRSFEMRNGRNLVDYFLFFATNSLKGLEKMKEAMWRVDPAGGFSFSDATNPAQITLFAAEPDFGSLRDLIRKRFRGGRASRDQVERFVIEETAFLASHYKRVLKSIEQDGGLTVVRASPQRKIGTFPDGSMVLEFF